MIGLQEFLEKSATTLQKEFDKTCGFFSSQKLLYEHSKKAVQDVESLRSLARELCGISAEATDAGVLHID